MLNEVDLRELRGFKPLRDLLVFQPGSSGGVHFHTLDVETLRLSEKVSFKATGFDGDSPVDLETHTMSVCRGYVSGMNVFKRIESGEETSDLKTAHLWGRSAYHYGGAREVLALRRPRNHSCASDNLVVVSYGYQKVLLEDEHAITSLSVRPLSVAEFRDHFRSDYPRVAAELIWELRSAHSITADQLIYQAESFRAKAGYFARLSDAITHA